MNKKEFTGSLCISILLCMGIQQQSAAQFLDCSDAITLSPNIPYNGSNEGGNSDVKTYSCAHNQTSPEAVYEIVLNQRSDITATLSNVDTDSGQESLNLLILGSCDENDCLANNVLKENAFVGNAPAGTYYVVVDGVLEDEGSFTVTVEWENATGGTTEVSDLENDQFLVYPTLFSDQLTIQSPAAFLSDNLAIEIWNVQGQLMDRYRLREQIQHINTKNYEKGAYILRYKTGGFSQYIKILK